MNRTATVPAVTLVLVVANLFAAFALVFNPELAFEFGFRPDRPRLQTAFTSLFLHANVLHLLGNMLFLAAVGSAVEVLTGSFRFSWVYFFSGLCGVAFHFVMTRRIPEPAPYIGASGCISGCVAYYTLRYMGLRVSLAPKFGASVAVVTAVWLALQVIGALVRLGETGGTSFWSHLGGFGAGVALSLVFRTPDRGQAEMSHAVIQRMSEKGPLAVQIVARQHLEEHPDDPRAMLELAKASMEVGDQTTELEVLPRLLDIAPDEDRPGVLERLHQLGRLGEVPPFRRAMYAERYKGDHPELAVTLLRSLAALETGHPARPDALLSLAGLLRETAPEEADAIVKDLARNHPLHAATEVARTRGWLP